MVDLHKRDRVEIALRWGYSMKVRCAGCYVGNYVGKTDRMRIETIGIPHRRLHGFVLSLVSSTTTLQVVHLSYSTVCSYSLTFIAKLGCFGGIYPIDAYCPSMLFECTTKQTATLGVLKRIGRVA